MTEAQQQLQSILEQEIAHAGDLSQILQQETTAISSRNAGELESVVKEKQSLIKQMETVTQQREQLLTQAGCASLDAKTITTFLRQWDKQGASHALWDKLLNLGSECRDNNQINGSAIELSVHTFEQALNLLRGTTAKPGIYSANGKTASQQSSRPLAQV